MSPVSAPGLVSRFWAATALTVNTEAITIAANTIKAVFLFFSLIIFFFSPPPACF
jgi:hypothetical protein